MPDNLVQKVNPAGLLPPPGNMHAHVVLAPANCQLAFLAGNVAIDAEGNVVGGDDLCQQATQAFNNIRIAVEAIGSKAENIVQMTIFVVGFQDDHIQDVNRGGAAAFGTQWPVTATTLLGVQALATKDFLIEVNAIVAVPAV